MRNFDDIAVGERAELVHVISAEDIARFADLTGDDNRLHVDPGFAATTGFKKPIAHGMLGASFISTIIGTKLPGDGALWFSQSLEFLLPVRAGDQITVAAEVVRKLDREKVIEMKVTITNQFHQVVTSGLSKVKLVEPEPRNEAAPLPEQGKSALVIGATGGIGQQVTRALARDGWNIAVHCHENKDAASALTKEVGALGLQAHTYQFDVADRSAVVDAVKNIQRRMNQITAVVNCATTRVAPVKILEMTWDDISAQITNQIKGSLNIVQAVAPIMAEHGYGKLVGIDTRYVDLPEPQLAHYITAKSALRGFYKSIALDLAGRGIRVNLISPGMTETSLISDVPEKTRLVTAARTPLKRLAYPEDVANAAVFLCSAGSDYLCGETIRLNGGQIMV
jgi:3-oxoacyl-[acyl-carrier protein] reductase